MSFGSRLKERREELGLKQSELGKLLGVTGSAIGNYENGISSPKADVLYQIFNVLKCDANYFFQDDMEEFEDNSFTVSEIKVLRKYRLLDSHGREIVDTILDLEYQRIEQAKEKTETKLFIESENDAVDNIIPFRRSRQPAGAGTGVFLGSDAFETIYVQENRLTRRASFGVPVSGDSMEPDYHDGDVLLIERTEDIEVGEVGIFIIEGNGYVKKLGNGKLVSLNPAYDPIQMNESIRCSGRVIGVLKSEWIAEK